MGTTPALGTSLLGAGSTALTQGSPYIAADLEHPGAKRQEKLAEERLITPGAYGLSDAQKRTMISDVVRAQRSGEGGLTAQAEEIERTARAQGPFGGGRALQATGELSRADAAGTAQIGGKAAELSSQVAQQQKATDVAAVNAAYDKALEKYKTIIYPAADEGKATFAQHTEQISPSTKFMG